MNTDKLYEGYLNKSLTMEEVWEGLAEIGCAPALLNDDNGCWAVSASGFCSLRDQGGDWNGTHFVEEADWKPTAREALLHFLDERE